MQNYTELQIADNSAVVNKSDIFLTDATTVCLRNIQKITAVNLSLIHI